MASLEDLRNTRLAKLKRLQEAGLEAYPASVSRDATLAESIERFDELSKKKELALVGRVLAIRAQGGITFLNFNDGTATFQALFKEGDTPRDALALFAETVDIGDFVAFTGSLFVTKRGEKTLLVTGWKMLAKSLLPLPEKWHGLADVDERFRKRYLDLVMNADVRARFALRSRLIRELRRFLDDAGYMEVETPILQPLPGGATALPFSTHHNALDIELYLRIAPELYLKKLLVGGFPKVYEIGRNFRNEGIDVTHNPEFTMLEFYESYSDSAKQMAFVESLIRTLAERLFGKSSLVYDSKSVDFGKPFARSSYSELIAEATGILDVANSTRDELVGAAERLGAHIEKHESREKALDAIFKRAVRPTLLEPTFVTGFPRDYLPLAKASKQDVSQVEAFQLYAGGLELVKAFSELNDPLDQRAQFLKQEEERKKGDKESQTTDEEFIEALEHGMPPAGGVGIGIDRLVMLFTDTKNIREVILFPTLRPKGNDR